MRVFARTSARLSVFSAAALLLCSLSAKADTIINVVNSHFENLTTPGVTGPLYDSTQSVVGWTTSGYNFVFSSDSSAHANGDYYNGSSLGLWIINTDGTSNHIGQSPDGGNFIAMDGNYGVGALTQVLHGLTIGEVTKVSFYFAGAQQNGNSYDSITTEAFKVSLGTQSKMTATLTDPIHGFTGWQSATLDFVPTETSETLSFLAVGTPSGQPPFSLLDGISVVQVTPEPSTLALLGTGVLAVGGMLRRRRQTAV